MEEIIFPNQIRMYRRLRGRSMQSLRTICQSVFPLFLKLRKAIAALTKNSWFALQNFLIALYRTYL